MSRIDSQLTPFERVECEILFRYWLCSICYWLCFLMCRCAVLNQKASKDQGSFGALIICRQFIKYWLNCCAKAVPFFFLSVFPFLMCGDLSLIWSVSLFAVRRFLVCCPKEGSDGLCFAGRTWSHRVGRGLQNPFSWSSRRFLLVINSLHQSSIASAVYLALNWNISIFSFSWLNTTMTENRKILNTSDLDGFDKVSCCGSSMILSLIPQLYPWVLVLWWLSSLESLGTVFKSSWESFAWPKCLSFALLIKICLPPRLK